MEKFFNDKNPGWLDNPIPFWLAKLLAKTGYDHYKYSRTYYSSDGHLMWIGGCRLPKEYAIPASTWRLFFYKLFNHEWGNIYTCRTKY